MRIGLLLLSLLSFQQSANAADASSVAQFKAVIGRHVFPADRDFITFRWEPQYSDLGTRDAVIVEAKSSIARFNDVSLPGTDEAGPGFFVETDPNSTAQYGQAQPGMRALKIAKGSMLLDGNNPYMNKSDQDVVNKIAQSLQCASNYGDEQLGEAWTLAQVVRTFRNSTVIGCRQVIIDALSQLDVQGIIYAQPTSDLIAGCRSPGVAINVIGRKAIDFDSMNYYAAAQDFAGDPNQTPFIRMMYDRNKDGFEQTYMITSHILENYRNGFGIFPQTSPPTEGAFRAWQNAHIMACGPQWAGEPRTTLWLKIHNANPALTKLLVSIAVAYDSVFAQGLAVVGSTPFFDVSILKAVQQAQFAPLGIPPEDWDRITALLSQGQLGQVSAAVGEGSHPPLDQQKLDYQLEHAQTSVQDVLRGLGYGPKVTTLLYNHVMLQNGGVPIFTGQPQVDAQRYNQILHQCLLMYQDSTQSPEQIWRSSCGINSPQ